MSERPVEQKRAFSIKFINYNLKIVSILACNAMWYKSDYIYQYCANSLIHISVEYLKLVKEEANMLVSVLGVDDVDQSNFLVKYK